MEWKEFEESLKKKKTNKLKGKKYIDVSSSFDIETTDNGEESFMYIWGFSFWNEYFEIGRTWEEFISFFDKLESLLERLNLNIIIYVHNLNFEYIFVNEILGERIKDYFAKGENDILYFKTKHTWFRCSAKLTRLNLEKSCVMYNTKHQKLVGDLDYHKTRYFSTELTDSEMQYFLHDLICVNEIVENVRIQKGCKSILNLPMTLTGFTRRKAKKNCESIEYHMNFKRLKINNEIFDMTADNQKGGSCECSIFKKNKIIHGVDSFDFVSQHIKIMLCDYFPMSEFKKYQGDENNLEEVYEQLQTRCCLFDMWFEEIELKKEKDFGIIGTSHIQNKNDCEILTQIDFRIIKAKNVHLTLNEIDLQNIFEFYDFNNFKIWNLYTAMRGRLPYQIREVVWKLLNEKIDYSKYKGTKKDFMYQNKKQELNSFSGMIQTKSIHNVWNRKKDGTFFEVEYSNSDKFHLLEDYHNSFAHFIFYPWGNWIISHSRRMCYDLIKCAKPGSHIYHDTDSCYATEFDENKIKELNKRIEQQVESYGYNVGNLGQAMLEHKNIDFKMIGLKQYAIKENGNVKITVCGLPKDNAKHLNNDLNNFKLGFAFPGAIKTAVYKPNKIHTLKDDKGNEFITGGCCRIGEEDFILHNMDSKAELLTGWIYSGI